MNRSERSLGQEVEAWDAAMMRLLRAVKGLRVQPTPEAIEQGIAKPTTRATVVGWGNHRWSIRVLIDGRKTPTGYSVRFWKPAK